MDATTTPVLHPRFACITTDHGRTLSAVVSSFFNASGVYFPVFAFPEVDSPYSDNAPFDEDSYFGRVIGLNAAVRINNAIVALRSEAVILAGLTDIQKGYVRAYLPTEMLIEVDSISEVDSKLAFLAGSVTGSLPCRESDIVPALFEAKTKTLRLHVDEAAPPTTKETLSGKKALVVIELTGEACDVVAANYAFSIGADVRFVPSITRAQVHHVHKQLHEWKMSESDHAHKRLRLNVTKRLKGINFLDYGFATFFTRGLPYGLVLKNIRPFTHVMTALHSDVLIVNSILYESAGSHLGSAIVFSPKEFTYEETEDVIAEFKAQNYVVKALLSQEATLKNLDDFGAHYPYDVLHVCSHGGETDGYYVIENFIDRKGAKHTLEYEEVVGFSPMDKDTVRMTSKCIFRRLDGLEWQSPELKRKNLPSYVYEDMRKSVFGSKLNKDAIRVRANYPIYASCHIKCYDSIHQGDFRVLASHGAPFIFNNTCSSWYEIAVMFIDAGARAYVGTLWNIGNLTAGKAAKVFYKEIVAGKTLMDGCNAMNASVGKDKYRDIYVFWGLHFSSLKPSDSASAAKQRVFNVLFDSFFGWLRKYRTTEDAEVRKNCVPILKFIYQEINADFAPDHLRALEGEVHGNVDDFVRGLPAEDDGLTERGVMDVPESYARSRIGEKRDSS